MWFDEVRFNLCEFINALSLISSQNIILLCIFGYLIEGMRKLVGRKHEINILDNLLISSKSELVTVYGRRRVGKTYLINEIYKDNIIFSFSGLFKSNVKTHLTNFQFVLSKKKKNLTRPKSWFEAFYQLEDYIESHRMKKKKVIFLDEFPWLDTRRSNFLSAFDNFWNNFASKRNDLVIVICGSAASYMIKNIVKSTGGLHNRITEKIHLKPFSLYETELLLRSKNVKLSQYDILQIYMCMGGIPHYLERIMPGESVPTIIDRLCFEKDGFLRNEFESIFYSLFRKAENHIIIIKALAKVRKGLTRKNILLKTKIKSGGTFSKTILELEESGFVESYQPFQGTKEVLYRLADEYSMFYLKFIQNTKPQIGGVWKNMYNQNSYKIWSGFSFETICMKHIEEIKHRLGISGVQTFTSSWVDKNSEKGAQIDLLIDRADNAINLCEIKFHKTPYTITKPYAESIMEKEEVFKLRTKTKKNVFITLISVFGIKENKYATQIVQNSITASDLFISK